MRNGYGTTNGSLIFADFVSEEDATVIAKLKKAGAILLGKHSMFEFAGREQVHFPFGAPRNPWNLELTPGGSSSGSGAATAASLCATSLGEDTGGSIRGPAHCCGLVGLRPSWGRVSRYGVFGGSWSNDTVGPISRTVRDCAMTLQAISGHDPNDPYTWNMPVPDYGKALDGGIKGIRVGVIQEAMAHPKLDPEYKDAVVKAVKVLAESGAQVEDASLPIIRVPSIGTTVWSVEYVALHRGTIWRHFEKLDHNTQIGFLTAAMLPAQAYYKVQRVMSLVRRQVLELLSGFDVLVFPTHLAPAQPSRTKLKYTSKEHTAAGYFRGSFNAMAAFASIPALSLPCGFTSSNLPLGLQIAGRPFEEETVLRVAHAYEQSTPWHTRRAQI